MTTDTDQARDREHLEAERDFLLASLDDLEAERASGGIDDASYECLAFMLWARPRSQRRRKTARGDE